MPTFAQAHTLTRTNAHTHINMHALANTCMYAALTLILATFPGLMKSLISALTAGMAPSFHLHSCACVCVHEYVSG